MGITGKREWGELRERLALEMKYANGIFRESIHSNLPDKRNVDNPKRQEDFKERWKLTRSLKKKEARRRWRQRQ